MSDFSRSLAAHGAALCVVETAKKSGLLQGSITVEPRLGDIERELFLRLLGSVAEHGKGTGGKLSPDEISSIFTFVAAKGAECAVSLFENKIPTFELTGMFDGKIPLAATERVIGFYKNLTFPSDCAENFLNWFSESAPAESDPHLTLFEALKWCFRISFHITWEFIEHNR